MIKVSDFIEALSRKFSVEVLPASATEHQRYEFLVYWTNKAGQVIDLLPAPDDVDKSAFADTEYLASELENLAVNPAVTLAYAQIRNLMLLSFIAASWSVNAQHPSARKALLSTNEVTTQELDADYKRRLAVMQAIVALGSSGTLDPLFAQKKSLGEITTAMIIGGVVVAIGTAAIYATMIVALVALFYMNKWVGKYCFDAQGNPREKTAEACPRLFSSLKDLADGPNDILGKVTTYAAVGLGVYALIVLGPDIVRTMRELKPSRA